MNLMLDLSIWSTINTFEPHRYRVMFPAPSTLALH